MRNINHDFSLRDLLAALGAQSAPRKIRFWAVLAAFCFVALHSTRPMYAATLYSVTDLGTLGGASSFATALNDNGHAVGYSLDGNGDTRAFFWTPGGGMQNLGILGTGSSQAFDISGSDNVVGQSGNRAFRWTPGGGVVLIDAANTGAANGLNENNEAIGYRDVGATDRTLRWSSANAVTNPFPLSNSAGVALNDLGQSVGLVGGSVGYYSPGPTVSSLGLFLPTDLNNSREIVGSIGGIAALLDFDTNTTTLLGKLAPSDTSSTALGISENGTIVGVSEGSGAFVADSLLTLTSLSSLLASGFAGWEILTATDVNSHGQIAGVGRFNGVDHAVILTPVPEPTSITLSGLAFIGTIAVVHRRAVPRGRRRDTKSEESTANRVG